MREPTFTTLFPKLFKGENEHLPHYLHNYLREITNIHHIISKTIQGREPTSTTLFTKLFKGENQHLPQYLQSYLRGENQHLPHYLQSYLRERYNNYHMIYKAI